MGRYISPEHKESILKKAQARGDKSLKEIAKANGIAALTLSKWLKPSTSEIKANFSKAERFRHLQAIVSISDDEISAYCRRHGFYTMQLKEWENDFMKNDSSDQKYKAEIIDLRKRNAELERALRRNEKALAEAAALLILKKKAEAIWGKEDEDV